MAFEIPTFNILCNIFPCTGLGYLVDMVGGTPRLANQPCNLAHGRRVAVTSTGGTTLPGIPQMTMGLLLPALTDIRGPQDNISAAQPETGIVGDYVECPSGTGRWYGVAAVDDVGKGFANEYRYAALLALPLTWGQPYL